LRTIETVKTIKFLIGVIIAFLDCSVSFAQGNADTGRRRPTEKVINSEPSDPYRLDYKNVFDNINYNQPLRPQVHFTPLTGQIGDPTGLVKYKGTYHLFYMSDEWSNQRRDNKNWGHATSSDCIYWSQKPPITNSIIDNRPGSGSGIVDWNNTLRLRKGPEKTLVVFYTDYGRGIALAFSNDAGKTWIRHKRNPVIAARKSMRDPNVFWYKPDQSWRMVFYENHAIFFYKSSSLLDWTFLSKMDGFFECPDMLQMPVDNDEKNKKWVLIDGNGSYFIGEFDGVRFTPETSKIPLGEESYLNEDGGQVNKYTKDLYATQSWKQSYEGDGPFYQLASMTVKPPLHTRTWSQQLTFPVELSLTQINHQLLLCRNPINGIKQLRYDPHLWIDIPLKPQDNPLSHIQGDVFEILLNIDLGNAKEVIFTIRGEKARYTVKNQQIKFLDSKLTVTPQGNKIRLRLIIDRNSVEIYANQGEVTMTRLFYPVPTDRSLSLNVLGGECRIDKMELYRLESIWLKKDQELGYQRESQPTN